MSQPTPNVVQPQPSPTTIQIMPTPDGNVVVVINQVTGQTVVFLKASDAKAVAANLERTASQAQTGLVIPNGIVLPGQT